MIFQNMDFKIWIFADICLNSEDLCQTKLTQYCASKIVLHVL